MASKDKYRIENIQNGRIDFYIPLTFETEQSYDELREKVADCIDQDISHHLAGIEASIRESFSKISDKIHINSEKSENRENSSKEEPFQKKISKSLGKQEPITTANRKQSIGNMTVELQPSINGGIAIKLIPEETKAYATRRDELLHEQKQYEKIYGLAFTNAQDRYVLLPLRLKLVNNQCVWLNAILYIFKNMMGILKIELPLLNVSTEPLMECNYNAYIGSVTNQWDMNFENQATTIDSICDAHLRRIANICKISIHIHPEGILRNTILVRYDGIPKQIENIPDQTQEDLYRIIAAPVMRIECASYKKIAREYLDSQSWGRHNSKYITSTTGGCLSIIDEELLNWHEQQCKKMGIDDLAVMEHFLIRDLCINVEFALVVLLLKQLNATNTYETKKIYQEDINIAQMKYNMNVMFISELQEYSYGTASEQVIAFERMMPYYLKEDIKAAKMQALDRIIADKESKRNNSFQTFMSVAGFIVALLFGLPAIYETLSIIRQFCFFIEKDIPYITATNLSFAVWVLLIVLIIAYMRKKYRKK